MDNVAWLVDIYGLGSGVFHDLFEIDTLMRRSLVYNGKCVDVGPHVGDNGHITAACCTHTEYLQTVLVMLEVCANLCLGRIGKVVIGIECLIQAFLRA